MKQTIFELLGISCNDTVRNLKGALKVAEELRNPDDRFAKVISDYPILVELAEAYIRREKWQSALDIIRVCFDTREEYARWTGKREVFLLEELVEAFKNRGREDIAQELANSIDSFKVS